MFNHPHFQSINTNISNPNPGMFTSTRPNYEPEKTSYRQVDVKIRIRLVGQASRPVQLNTGGGVSLPFFSLVCN